MCMSHHTHNHTCMHKHTPMYAHTHTHVFMRAFTHAFAPAHTHAHTHMHTHTHLLCCYQFFPHPSPLLWSTETIGKSEGSDKVIKREREREGGGERKRHVLPPSLTHSLTHSLPSSLTASFPPSLTPNLLPPSLSLCRNPSHHRPRFDFH